MAAQTDTGTLTYFLNGEPIQGIYKTDTGGLTYFLNGEPLKSIFGTTTTINLGQFFLMF